MNEPRGGKAFLAASLTCVAWAAWVGSASQLGTLYALGPLLFWSLPVLIALCAWVLLIVLAPRAVPVQRRILGAANGIVAALLGIPLSVASWFIYAGGIIGPFLFLVLGPFIVALGFAVMFGLYREAFLGMSTRPAPGAESAGP
jgi:hypothetical protein